MVVAAGLYTACQRMPPSAEPTRPGSVVGPDAGKEAPTLVPASRCGECHGKMETEWRSSAHARADVSALYRAMRAAAGSPRICDRCHAPLRAVSGNDPVVAEGVTCDVCHTMASVQLTRADGTGFVLHPEDNLRYGPLCDTLPHYFHRMGCSVLHRDGSFCAACHNWSVQLPSGETLTLLPEYSEWRDASSALTSFDCQVCHMPSVRAEAAVGSRERTIRNHSFDMRSGLLSRALSGQAQVTTSGGKLQVALSLTNSGAGHAVPTGLPERRLQVGVLVLDAAERVIAHQEHSYGRMLVDSAGREVPFFAAVRVREDTRLRTGETRHDQFQLELPTSGQLRVYVNWRAIAPNLVAQLGVVPAPKDEPMISASVRLPLMRKRLDEPVILQLK